MASDLSLLHAQYVADPSDLNLNALLAKVTRYALNLCRKRSVTTADAEEVAQETAINVHTKLAQYDSARSSFRTWVHRCTLDQVSILRRKAEAFAKDAAGQEQPASAPSPRSSRSSRMNEVIEAAGDNAELINLILVMGDVPAAARHLGLTTLAAQRRLKRLGSKIILSERSKSIREMP